MPHRHPCHPTEAGGERSLQTVGPRALSPTRRAASEQPVLLPDTLITVWPPEDRRPAQTREEQPAAMYHSTTSSPNPSPDSWWPRWDPLATDEHELSAAAAADRPAEAAAAPQAAAGAEPAVQQADTQPTPSAGLAALTAALVGPVRAAMAEVRWDDHLTDRAALDVVHDLIRFAFGTHGNPGYGLLAADTEGDTRSSQP